MKLLQITPQKSLLIIAFYMSVIKLSAQVPVVGAELDINNIRAKINNELSLFWDPTSQVPMYEVPKGGGKHTIFAGGLWISGYDASNNLHCAAQTYRQVGEVAFYPGPLDTINGTSADPFQWNNIYKINRATILSHIANWNTSGYVVPTEIATWPANAPAGSNFNPVLAPFFDINANQIYEPNIGEFPVIEGDQAIYFICNDNYQANTLGVPNLGVEIHVMAYAYDAPNDPALNNSIFFKYQIANFSGINYSNVQMGLWTDVDLGNASDDYIGTDVQRNLVYAYNGDANDEGGSGYGLNPPAQGIKFLSHSLINSMYYNNVSSAPDGNPSIGLHYRNYSIGLWQDSLPLTYGGDGRGNGAGATTTPCSYVFPGTTDSLFTQDWTMATAGLAPTDVRNIASVYLNTLPAGNYVTVDLVYSTAFGSSGPNSSVALLESYADDIANRYGNGNLVASTPTFQSQISFTKIFPSLATDFIQVSMDRIENYTIEIYNIEGKLIMLKNNVTGISNVDVSELNQGVYIAKIVAKSGTNVHRFVKQ